MGNVRFIGLDVHKESIVVAVADSDASAPSVVSEIPNDIPNSTTVAALHARTSW